MIHLFYPGDITKHPEGTIPPSPSRRGFAIEGRRTITSGAAALGSSSQQVLSDLTSPCSWDITSISACFLPLHSIPCTRLFFSPLHAHSSLHLSPSTLLTHPSSLPCAHCVPLPYVTAPELLLSRGRSSSPSRSLLAMLPLTQLRTLSCHLCC